jgi:predicted hotdog family 3-hydroxylacyl-ACP dehydratase
VSDSISHHPGSAILDVAEQLPADFVVEYASQPVLPV